MFPSEYGVGVDGGVGVGRRRIAPTGATNGATNGGGTGTSPEPEAPTPCQSGLRLGPAAASIGADSGKGESDLSGRGWGE
jgi:hypothetical protein